MTMHNSGIREIEDILGIPRDTVMATLKRAADKVPARQIPPPSSTPPPKVNVAELDEFWSFVGSKKHQRWTWYAWDAERKCILAYHNGRRTDDAYKALCKQLLAHYDIRRYNTDDWQSYWKVVPTKKHHISKQGTQRMNART